jgi:hypothetical protein
MVRFTGPRVLVFLVTAALVGYVFVLAPRLAIPGGLDPVSVGSVDDPHEPGRVAARPLFPPAGQTFIGVTTREGTYDLAPVDRFQKAIRHQPAVLMFSHGWAGNKFNRVEFDTVARRGMLPMLSWEPWNYADDSTNPDGSHKAQPKYRLSNIAAGNFDAYIRSYAVGIKNLKYPVAIRFAHEMNGFWYPWGAEVNGNSEGDYIKAWKHVRGVFDAVGAANAIWVWSPNVIYNKAKLAPFYPGDDLVDWVGLSGYYGTEGVRSYRTPETTFNASITHIRTFTRKPIVITETAATDSGGLKARWVGDLFRYLTQHPDIIGFIWYESVKETDWRIAPFPAAAAAFAEAAADQRYGARWSVDVVPRTTAEFPAPTSSPSASASAKPTGKKSPTRSPTAGRSRTRSPRP